MSYIYSIDVSNWQGNDIRPLISQHQPTHVVVRASIESEALRQIAISQCKQVIEIGCTLDIYSWMYPWTNPEQAVNGWLSVPGDAGTPFHNLWIDVEETNPRALMRTTNKAPSRKLVPAMGDRLKVLAAQHLVRQVNARLGLRAGSPRKLASQIEPWLDSAFARLDQLGISSGIYTGAWFWRDYVGDSQRFKDRKLWYSNYDTAPNFDAWPWQRFGGWEQPTGKQWSSEPVDRNVFSPSILDGSNGNPPPPVPGEEALHHLRFLANHIINTYEAKLRADADELVRLKEQYAWALRSTD